MGRVQSHRTFYLLGSSRTRRSATDHRPRCQPAELAHSEEGDNQRVFKRTVTTILGSWLIDRDPYIYDFFLNCTRNIRTRSMIKYGKFKTATRYPCMYNLATWRSPNTCLCWSWASRYALRHSRAPRCFFNYLSLLPVLDFFDADFSFD